MHAGVSPRTVYRYFPSKADLVFHSAPNQIERMRELVMARPPAEAPFTALSNALVEMAPELDTWRTAAQGRVIAADPTLYRYSLEVRDEIARNVGEALVARDGADTSDADRLLLGHLASAALLVATREWRNAGPERGELGSYVSRTLAAIPRLARMSS